MIFVAVSTGHFDPLVSACDALKQKYSFLGQIGSSAIKPGFPHFCTCTPEELMRHMREAELVIAHAGTGMLSMLYRLKKKAIIIPKQLRYGEANDGQVELAKKWAALGMCTLCLDVNDLEIAIEECRHREYRFPHLPSLGAYLRETLRPPLRHATGSYNPAEGS